MKLTCRACNSAFQVTDNALDDLGNLGFCPFCGTEIPLPTPAPDRSGTVEGSGSAEADPDAPESIHTQWWSPTKDALGKPIGIAAQVLDGPDDVVALEPTGGGPADPDVPPHQTADLPHGAFDLGDVGPTTPLARQAPSEAMVTTQLERARGRPTAPATAKDGPTRPFVQDEAAPEDPEVTRPRALRASASPADPDATMPRKAERPPAPMPDDDLFVPEDRWSGSQRDDEAMPSPAPATTGEPEPDLELAGIPDPDDIAPLFAENVEPFDLSEAVDIAPIAPKGPPDTALTNLFMKLPRDADEAPSGAEPKPAPVPSDLLGKLELDEPAPPSTPLPAVHSETSDEWRVERDAPDAAVHTRADILRRIRAGELGPEDRVARGEGGDMVQLIEVPEFRRYALTFGGAAKRPGKSAGGKKSFWSRFKK